MHDAALFLLWLGGFVTGVGACMFFSGLKEPWDKI